MALGTASRSFGTFSRRFTASMSSVCVTFTVKPFWRRCSAHSMQARQTVGVYTSMTGKGWLAALWPATSARIRSRRFSMACPPCSP
jgi:hypothetical protein